MEIIEIELMMMRSWPALEEKTYDGWIMRFSEGYTKRANSINPMYESYFDLEEKYELVKMRLALATKKIIELEKKLKEYEGRLL